MEEYNTIISENIKRIEEKNIKIKKDYKNKYKPFGVCLFKVMIFRLRRVLNIVVLFENLIR